MSNKNTNTYTRQLVHSIKYYQYTKTGHNLRQYAEKCNIGLLFLNLYKASIE